LLNRDREKGVPFTKITGLPVSSLKPIDTVLWGASEPSPSGGSDVEKF